MEIYRLAGVFIREYLAAFIFFLRLCGEGFIPLMGASRTVEEPRTKIPCVDHLKKLESPRSESQSTMTRVVWHSDAERDRVEMRQTAHWTKSDDS